VDLLHPPTPHHARYFAHDLTLQRAFWDDDRLARSLFDAAVVLNPHQIEAALFAMRSPLGEGVLLADEVGLGKTIEAGLVLCQAWAERRRHLLVICPAALRRQWAQELSEKFHLPARVIDAAAHRQMKASGDAEPFSGPQVAVVSYHFAAAMQAEVQLVPWHLVVIDEAHKLRNAYRTTGRVAQRLRVALEGRRKLLLTATPLQSSLLELFGLSTFLDEHLFGDADTFKGRFCRGPVRTDELRERIEPYAWRTLRRQVTEYVRFTARHALTRPFRPSDAEHVLYEAVSAFLQRPFSYAIPPRQQAMATLVVRKFVASSSQALAGALDVLRTRLQALLEGRPEPDLVDRLIEDEDISLDELAEAEADAAEASEDGHRGAETRSTPLIDRKAVQAEMAELDGFARWARGVGTDAKARALVEALRLGFDEMERVGAARKAVVFTESRRTQAWLRGLLEGSGYAGRVVLFNGSNSDPEARAIYERWAAGRTMGAGVRGSRAIDQRTALVEHFRDHAEILLATDAGAEGINLHFASLVIHYDLPWNPQRIEQRIGRCHRYGQHHDVVVINFLNERNDADRRLLQLLGQKLSLFSGLFGASDEVLGAIDSGIDFERRVLAIYRTCRTSEQIEAAFDELQSELEIAINERMVATRRALLEHFDDDVHDRLRTCLSDARERLDQWGRRFWDVTRYALRDAARFSNEDWLFDLDRPPHAGIDAGRYRLVTRERPSAPGEMAYRPSHRLGEHALSVAREAPTPVVRLAFDLSHGSRIAALEPLKGKSGWLTLRRLVVQSFERAEHLLFAGIIDDGGPLDPELCEKLFRLDAGVHPHAEPTDGEADRLDAEAQRRHDAALAAVLEQHDGLYRAERERLRTWADDQVKVAEHSLDETKAQIRASNRAARLAPTTAERHAMEVTLRDLHARLRRQRQRIFEVEDEIAARRDWLIAALEQRLTRRTTVERLFTVRWTVR